MWRRVPDGRAHSQPQTAATSTTQGNGIFSRAKMATKEASASAHSSGVRRGQLSVLLPMRQAACSTSAVTAGLMP
jgi:hypothetical protein